MSVAIWGASIWGDGNTWGPTATPVRAAGVTYTLDIDSDRDETFAVNLSSRWRGIVAAHGMVDDEFAAVAPPAELEATLDNNDGAFLPEDTTAAFYGKLDPGPLARLRATWDGSNHLLWIGRLRALNIDQPGLAQVPRNATLVASDIFDDLLKAEHKPALQQNVTMTDLIEDVLDNGAADWPYAATPDTPSTWYALETGQTEMAWMGDNADTEDAGVSALGYISDFLPAEGGGRVFWDPMDSPLGKLAFHNREHDITASVADTFTFDDFLPLFSQYDYADKLTNKVTFHFTPRKLGSAGSVIYTYPSLPYPIGKANLVTEFTPTFRDADNPDARIGAIDPITPVANTDYEAFDELPPHPKASEDRTDRLTVTVTYYADRADVKIESSENSTIYLTTFQLRGTPLITFDRQTIVEENTASIDAYELRAGDPVHLLGVDTETFARALARWYIGLYAEPFGRFAYVTFEATESARLMGHALNRRVGDRITITSTRLGHNRDYAITGIRHAIGASAGSHRVTWFLKPLPQYTYFIADVSLADSDDRIAL